MSEPKSVVEEGLDLGLLFADLDAGFVEELVCLGVIAYTFLCEGIGEHFDKVCVCLKKSYRYGSDSVVRVVVLLDKLSSLGYILLYREDLLVQLGGIHTVFHFVAEVCKGNLFFKLL